jgi:hypothetical protein
MITVINQPTDVSFGIANCFVEFTGNAINEATTFIIELIVFTPLSEGISVTLSFGNGSINQTFIVSSSETPIEDGFSLPKNGNREDVISTFNSNYIVSKYYSIAAHPTYPDVIVLTSKGKGSFYYMSINEPSGGQFFVQTTSGGEDLSFPNNYQSVWEIVVNNQTIFSELYYDIPDDLSLKHFFASLINKVISFPFINPIIENINVLSPFLIYFRAAEYYNNSYQKVFTFNTFKYVPSLEPDPYFLYNLEQSLRFVHPAPKYVWSDANFNLYFFGLQDDVSYYIFVTIHYTDNIIISTMLQNIEINCNKGDLIVIPAGINTRDLDSISPDKKIWKYKYTLRSGDTPEDNIVAETEYINIVPKPQFAEQFIFRTSKAVYHSILNCKIVKNLITEGFEVRNENDLDYQNNNSYLEYDCISDYMTLEEILIIEKALLINDFYWYIDNLPNKISIVPESFLIYDQKQDLYQASFKYRTVANIVNNIDFFNTIPDYYLLFTVNDLTLVEFKVGGDAGNSTEINYGDNNKEFLYYPGGNDYIDLEHTYVKAGSYYTFFEPNNANRLIVQDNSFLTFININFDYSIELKNCPNLNCDLSYLNPSDYLIFVDLPLVTIDVSLLPRNVQRGFHLQNIPLATGSLDGLSAPADTNLSLLNLPNVSLDLSTLTGVFFSIQIQNVPGVFGDISSIKINGASLVFQNLSNITCNTVPDWDFPGTTGFINCGINQQGIDNIVQAIYNVRDEYSTPSILLLYGNTAPGATALVQINILINDYNWTVMHD